MRKACLITLGVFLFLPVLSIGKGNSNILRGGFGFLFPDHNSFSNYAQFAGSYGAGFEMQYHKTEGTNQSSLTPSFVFGNGSLGIGGCVTRAGSDLQSSDSSFDSVGGGIGYSLFKKRVTLGVGYTRSIDVSQLSDGTFAASINMNAAGRRGPSVGLGFDTTVNRAGGDQKSGKIGFGYSFGMNRTVELLFSLNDLDNTTDYSGGLYFTLGGKFYYFGGAYDYLKLVSHHQIAARAGLILGNHVDFSIQASRVLSSDAQTDYGASLRASF